jgi:uncharacterized protein involved in type VI secretion and phage assembly
MNGDINAPVVVGRLYNDEDRPPLNRAEELVYVPPYLPSPPLVRRIYFEFPQGMIFKITDHEVDIKAGDTKVIIHRDGDIIIESYKNINVLAHGDATLKSEGDMTISGASVRIESDQNLNLKSGSDMKMDSGASAVIESSTTMKVEARADMTIKGARVNIN